MTSYPSSLVHINKTITGDYDHFVCVLTPDVGAPVTGAPGQVDFDLHLLFGWNIRTTPGIQTHTLNVTVEARDPSEAVLDSDSAAPVTYDADPDS
jgi:hypothetical protein